MSLDDETIRDDAHSRLSSVDPPNGAPDTIERGALFSMDCEQPATIEGFPSA